MTKKGEYIVQSTSQHIKEFEDHSIWIKKNFPEIKIVWGGVHPTILSKECSVSDYIDHVFIGQGEIVFPNLVLDIINGENMFPKEVRGHSPENMDQFSPAWDKADLKQYIFSEKHSVRSPVTKIHNKADSVFEKIKEDIEITDPKHETQTSRRVLDDIKNGMLVCTSWTRIYFIIYCRAEGVHINAPFVQSRFR